MSPIAPPKTINDSYTRFSGPAVTLSSTGVAGPQIKSKKQSALERYEAEQAIREKEFQEKYGMGGMYERTALAQRDVAERLDPSLRLGRNVKDRLTNSVNQRMQQADIAEAQNRYNYSLAAPFRGAQGGTNADYQKWRNYQEVQQGTPGGRFLLMQRAAQLGGNVNSAEYKDVQQQLRNAQLNQGYNNLY
jgi:hypothetical protein